MKIFFISFFLFLFFVVMLAYGVSSVDYVILVDGGFVVYVLVGVKYMFMGYDYLFFLFGVFFYLSGFWDIFWFIIVFILGYCIMLIGVIYLGVIVDEYLVDVVIVLSLVYKGFENFNGFEWVFKVLVLDLLFMVFVFGLIYGFGLFICF